MRLIVGYYSLSVLIFVVSARPNAPSTSTGVDENGAVESSNNITNRILEPEVTNNVTPKDVSEGMEVQSIQVSSIMSSKSKEDSEAKAPIPASTEKSDIGRAVMSTSPTPIGESLKTVTKQLLQSPTATDMVITDMRTPPKIQQQIELISPGKGEAVPILIEEETHMYENSNEQNTRQPSTPSSGLSTWILLNGDFSSTPYSYNKKPNKSNEKYSSTPTSVYETSSKWPIKPIIEMVKNNATVEKIKHKEEHNKKGPKPTMGVVKPLSRKPVNATAKPTVSSTTATISDVEPGKPLVTLQDSKFKNKTPIIVGRIPLPTKDKEKQEIVAISSARPPVSTLSPSMDTLNSIKNLTRFGTPVVTFPHVPPRIKPVSIMNTTTKDSSSSNTIYNSPSTIRPFISTTLVNRNNSSSNEALLKTTTQSIISSTEKKTKTSSQKKKKKRNKNRKNKPSKKPSSAAESKITMVDINAASKVPGGSTSRPLSTRIYNYLAREVMPNVGIGVVGLMLTAGLAGLFLYPFGGGIAARRTSYERPIMSKYGGPGPGPGIHRPHHYYNPNSYNHGSVGMDNGQPEEAVLGQVLTGMDYSPYSRERPSSNAPTSPIYDPNDNYNSPDVFGYAGATISPNTQYSTINAASNTNNIKYTKIQQEPQEQKHPTKTSLTNPTDTNQVPTENKFSNLDAVSNTNEEQHIYADNTPSNDKHKSYKADMTNFDYDKYMQNTNYRSNAQQKNEDNANQYTTESSVYNPEDDNNNNYNNEFVSYSASAGSVHSDDKSYAQSADVKNHRQESNFYQEFEDKKANFEERKELENDTNIIEQPSYSALEGIPNYNVEASNELYKEVGNHNAFNYHNDHGIIIEHGPRNLKIKKRSVENVALKESLEELNNEIDGEMMDDKKQPIEHLLSSVEVSTSQEIITSSESTDEISTESVTIKSQQLTPTNKYNDTEKIEKNQFNASNVKKPSPQQNEEFSLISLIRRVTQLKLQLGLTFLQTTTQAFSRYMENLQQRMESVVSAINNHNKTRYKEKSTNPKIVVPSKQTIEQETTTDNFVQIPNLKANDVEKIQVQSTSEKSEEISTIKVVTFSN